MQSLFDTYTKTGNLYHAYLIEGGGEKTLIALTSFFEKSLCFTCKANPDYHYITFETFGIDDGRAIQNRAYQKSFGERKIFVISFDSITREAQNALLKLFEEPTEGTHFFLMTRTSEILLPTLKSRLLILKGDDLRATDEKFITSFLRKSKVNRLKDLKEMIESKDKEEAIHFLSGLEEVLHRGGDMAENTEIADALYEIGLVKRYLNDRSPSVKMILEHIALTMPSFK